MIECKTKVLIKRFDLSLKLLFVHTFTVGPIPTALLFQLLPLASLIRRLTPQPKAHKSYPSNHGNPHTGDPYPSSTDHPAARPFVMGKMPYCHLPLDIDISQERSLVIDAEGKNAMLIRKFECGAEDGAIRGMGGRLEIEAVKGG